MRKKIDEEGTRVGRTMQKNSVLCSSNVEVPEKNRMKSHNQNFYSHW